MAAAPGWYRDPNDPYAETYWDGARWTGHRRGASAGRPPYVPAPLPQRQALQYWRSLPRQSRILAALVLVPIIALVGLFIFGQVTKDSRDEQSYQLGLELGEVSMAK
jgi:hypothetical protein